MKPKVASFWFSDEVSPWRTLWFTEYLQSSITEPRAGYVRELFYTKHIDLTQEEAQIIGAFSPPTRRQVLRAAREGIEIREVDDFKKFVLFFNRFAHNKRLDYRISLASLMRIKDEVRLFEAVRDGETITMHLFVCDRSKSRARFLYGASILREEGKTISNAVIGVANKCAHYREMCLFKQEGFRIFDFGGYSYQTEDPDLANINFFKDGFGGVLVCEANYRSLPLHLASRLINWRNKAKLNRSPGPDDAIRQRPMCVNEQIAELREDIK